MIGGMGRRKTVATAAGDEELYLIFYSYIIARPQPNNIFFDDFTTNLVSNANRQCNCQYEIQPFQPIVIA